MIRCCPRSDRYERDEPSPRLLKSREEEEAPGGPHDTFRLWGLGKKGALDLD